MTCPVCERPYPVPGLARAHLAAHWMDYIATSMRAWATADSAWLDFGPWLRAQVKLTRELEAKYGCT